jgi:hypothetical protein
MYTLQMSSSQLKCRAIFLVKILINFVDPTDYATMASDDASSLHAPQYASFVETPCHHAVESIHRSRCWKRHPTPPQSQLQPTSAPKTMPKEENNVVVSYLGKEVFTQYGTNGSSNTLASLCHMNKSVITLSIWCCETCASCYTESGVDTSVCIVLI